MCADHMVEEPSRSAAVPAAEHCHRKALRRAAPRLCRARPAGAACTRCSRCGPASATACSPGRRGEGRTLSSAMELNAGKSRREAGGQGRVSVRPSRVGLLGSRTRAPRAPDAPLTWPCRTGHVHGVFTFGGAGAGWLRGRVTRHYIMRAGWWRAETREAAGRPTLPGA